MAGVPVSRARRAHRDLAGQPGRVAEYGAKLGCIPILSAVPGEAGDELLLDRHDRAVHHRDPIGGQREKPALVGVNSAPNSPSVTVVGCEDRRTDRSSG